MTDQPQDPHQPPWTRRPGGGSDGPSAGSSGAGGPGPAPGGRDWLRKPGDDTLADAQRPPGAPGGPGGPQGAGPGGPHGGGPGPTGGGRGPLIAVGAVIAVLLVAVVAILGVLVTRDGETVVVRRPPPVTATTTTPVAPPPTATSSGGTTTTAEATAPPSGATATSTDGTVSLPVPGGWEYRSSSYGSGSASIGLTPPISSGDFEGSYLGVTLTVSRSYSYSSSPAEDLRRRRESDRSSGYTVSSLPDASIAGAPAEGQRTVMDRGTTNERRVYLATKDGRDYELRTYGSPEANRRWESQVRAIMVGVRAR